MSAGSEGPVRLLIRRFTPGSDGGTGLDLPDVGEIYFDNSISHGGVVGVGNGGSNPARMLSENGRQSMSRKTIDFELNTVLNNYLMQRGTSSVSIEEDGSVVIKVNGVDVQRYSA